MQDLILKKQRYKKVILLELNEISKKIIDDLIQKKYLKNFEFIDKHHHYLKTLSETEYLYCEPWIQWVTVHTGKKFSEHNTYTLGSNDNIRHKQVFETLSDSDIESAIIGSMNVHRGSMKGGFFFPDPWSKNNDVYPNEFKPLWSFVSALVHKKSLFINCELPKIIFLLFKLKVPASFFIKTFYAIVSTKVFKLRKWKMASLFDELFFYIFMHLFRNEDYKFYSLFLNSAAHYQHHFWRNYDKKSFSPDIISPDCYRHDDPITYGFQRYDYFLGLILKSINRSKDTLLIIASALTQIPYTRDEDKGGMNYYRLKNHADFCLKLGFESVEIYLLMSRDWEIRSNNTALLDPIAHKLRNLMVENEPLFEVKSLSENTLFIKTAVTKHISQNSKILSEGKEILSFGHVFKNIAIKSGHHSGLGHLWISDSLPTSSDADNQEIDLSSIKDIILQALV